MSSKKNYAWYATLKKPSWAPPSSVFGPVWTILYIGIAITFSYTAYLYFTQDVSLTVFCLLVINLVSNVIFTPIQFGLKNNKLAFIDILVVLCSLIAFVMSVYPSYEWIALAQVPYLLWVSFATILQGSITYLNR